MSLRGHPHLLLIIWILLSGMAASITAAIIMGAEFRGYLVGNPVFLVTLSTLVAATGIPTRLRSKDFLAIAFALILLASMALVGLLMVDTSTSLAKIAAGPLTSVGAYPSGPDVWFPFGAAFWFASSFCLTIASCFTGTLAARLFPRRKAR